MNNTGGKAPRLRARGEAGQSGVFYALLPVMDPPRGRPPGAAEFFLNGVGVVTPITGSPVFFCSFTDVKFHHILCTFQRQKQRIYLYFAECEIRSGENN